MDTFWHDVRFALRSLARHPGFTLVSVLILALGIGAATPTFSFVNVYLLRPLPFEQPENLVHVWGTDRQKGWDTLRISFPEFHDWKERNSVFEDMAVFNYTVEDLTGGDRPEQFSAGRVSANCFQVLGVEPLMGRTFSSDEERPGGPDVVILSHDFWQRRRGGDPQILGSKLEVDRRSFTVIGVMAADFVFPLPNTELWLPRVYDSETDTRDRRYLQALARLEPGVSRTQAQQEMDLISQQLAEQYPDNSAHRGVNLVGLRSALNFADEIFRVMAIVMAGANLFVLLIASANVSSLLLSRGLKRTREVAIRAALGASRTRLVRQFLVESSVLALLASALGLVIAYWMVSAMAATIPDDLYRVGRLSMDVDSLLFTLAVALFTALCFGLTPALRFSRMSHWHPLKEAAGTATTGRSSLRLQYGLVAGELGLALVLLVGTSLMVQTFLQMRSIDPGFQANGVLSLRLVLPSEHYPTRESRKSFHNELLQQARAVPGVLSAATVNYLPLNHEMYPVAYSVPGEPVAPEGQASTASLMRVSPDYFDVMGIPLVLGRSLEETDDEQSLPVLLVNETLSTRLVGQAGDPVGMRLQLEDFERPHSVVGVVGNTKHWDLAEAPRAQVYIPQAQNPGSYFRIVVRTAGNPLDLTAPLRQVVWGMDAHLPISEVRSMERVVEDFLLPQRTISGFLTGLSAGALALAVIGIYGLMAFMVSLRRREVGIRMALGAAPTDVLRLIMGRGLLLTLAGLGGGLLVSLVMAQLMGSLLFGVSSLNAFSFLALPLALGATAMVSCYLPARLASRTDPVATLRHE